MKNVSNTQIAKMVFEVYFGLTQGGYKAVSNHPRRDDLPFAFKDEGDYFFTQKNALNRPWEVIFRVPLFSDRAFLISVAGNREKMIEDLLLAKFML